MGESCTWWRSRAHCCCPCRRWSPRTQSLPAPRQHGLVEVDEEGEEWKWWEQKKQCSEGKKSFFKNLYLRALLQDKREERVDIFIVQGRRRAAPTLRSFSVARETVCPGGLGRSGSGSGSGNYGCELVERVCNHSVQLVERVRTLES